MIRLKSNEEIARLRVGGRRLAAIMAELLGLVRPGITTAELDQAAYRLATAERGDRPSFLHYRPAGASRPFPASLCVSINDEVVHGIPGGRALVEGDVVGLDLGLLHDGLYTDMARTVVVGTADADRRRLIAAAEEALGRAVAAARPGGRLGDIGAAIRAVAKAHGLGYVTALGGHGVGHAVHEEPQIGADAKRGSGITLAPGLVIAIEPMLTLGSGEVLFSDDGYTVTTADGSLAAHIEDTVAITEQGAEILTVV